MAAGERSLREFPYYERRYGERGRRFCGSDTAWLITLCDRGRAVAIEQTNWLGAVLSSRGMPQYLLEQHLLVLHDELKRAMPRGARRYAVLQHCARQLATRRESKIAPEEFHRLARAFDERVASVRGGLEGMGPVLVSAVADEALGLTRAVSSLESFLCDEKEFASKWRHAVRDTIAEARSLTQSSQS